MASLVPHISPFIARAAQITITTLDTVRNDSNAYRYVLDILNKQIFKAIEYQSHSPEYFRVTKRYTEATGTLFDRLENCAKLLTFSPILKFFNGAYAEKSFLYKTAYAALLAVDIQTGIDFGSSCGVNFSEVSNQLGKVNFFGMTPKGAFFFVAQHAHNFANGILALDAFDRWHAAPMSDEDTATHQIKVESAKREAIAYVADFTLGVMVAKGVKNVPALSATAVACLAFKIYSVVFNAENKEALASNFEKTPNRTFQSKYWTCVHVSESNWEAKALLIKMSQKLAVLAGAAFGTVSSSWVAFSGQAQLVEKLMENNEITSVGKDLSVLMPNGKYFWNDGVKPVTVATISLFALKALNNLSFGSALGYYKHFFLSYRIGTIPTLKLVTGLLIMSMTGALAFEAWNKATPRDNINMRCSEKKVVNWKEVQKDLDVRKSTQDKFLYIQKVWEARKGDLEAEAQTTAGKSSSSTASSALPITSKPVPVEKQNEKDKEKEKDVIPATCPSANLEGSGNSSVQESPFIVLPGAQISKEAVGIDNVKIQRYEQLLQLTDPKVAIAAYKDRIDYKIRDWNTKVVNEDARVRQQTLDLCAKIGKFALATMSVIVTIAGANSVRVSLGLIALGFSADALGYMTVLDGKSTQRAVRPTKPTNFYVELVKS